MPVSEREAKEIANSFRPNWRPLLLTVVPNVLLAVLLLGVPYLRGRSIAGGERAEFARVAQCLLGGEVSKTAGFGLPEGDRDHFAANVLFAPSDWPLPCRSRLRELAPPEAIFLWPSVKQAGADLRAVIKLIDRELVMLHRARTLGEGRIPTRPLLALAKLQAAVTLMAKAAGTDVDIDNDAIAFTRPLALAAPARLPLTAAEGATLEVSSAAGALEALALDGSGLSWLRVDAGKIDRERVKRSSLVRAVVRAGSDPYVVWATPEARCREREDHCAQRATGVAAYDKGAGHLPVPTWLTGHPAGRPDRVLRVLPDGRVDLLALASAGSGLSLRRFHLSKTPTDSGPAADPPAPVQPDQDLPISTMGTATSAFLLGSEPVQVAYAQEADGQITAGLASTLPNAEPMALPALTGTGPWITACVSGATRWVAYGSSSTQSLLRIDQNGVAQPANTQPAAITAPFHPDNAALDHVRVLCTDTGALLFVLDAQASLRLTVCSNHGVCAQAHALADRVSAFSALTTQDATFVAYLGVGRAREIRVLTLDAHGAIAAPASTKAACWDPSGGMCGVPTLISDGPRVILLARDGEDLLAIETDNGGAAWSALAGVQIGRAANRSAHDPLQQHRIRKGID